MKTNDILAQIDEALYDSSVSVDAMRSRPAESDGERQQDGYTADYAWSDEATATSQPEVWIAAAGTDPREQGWQRLDGIASVEFGEDVATVEISPHTEALVRTLRRASGADRVVVQRTPEQLGIRLAMTDDEIAEFQRNFQAFIEGYAAAYRRAVEGVAGALQQLREGFQGGGWMDTNGDPVEPPVRPSPPLPRRDGRPAWQSQYGPARRRR